MARRLAAALLFVALVAVPAARGDGDPASDVLLTKAVFSPPGVPAASTGSLEAAVQQAKAKGYVLRVALIGSVYDLGSVGVLYRQPKRYARFLGQELTLVYSGRLLVAMPNGLAVSKKGVLVPSEQRLVDPIPAPGSDRAAIASAATRAVVRLAASAGVKVTPPPAASSTTNDTGRERVIIIAVTLVAVAIGIVVVFIRRRRPS